jgi:hypothetical protein
MKCYNTALNLMVHSPGNNPVASCYMPPTPKVPALSLEKSACHLFLPNGHVITEQVHQPMMRICNAHFDQPSKVLHSLANVHQGKPAEHTTAMQMWSSHSRHWRHYSRSDCTADIHTCSCIVVQHSGSGFTTQSGMLQPVHARLHIPRACTATAVPSAKNDALHWQLLLLQLLPSGSWLHTSRTLFQKSTRA